MSRVFHSKPFVDLYSIRIFGLCELDDKADNQGENGERVRNRDADEHRGLDFSRRFGIAADGFQCAANENTETDTRADDAETYGNRHSECFCYFNIHMVNSFQLLAVSFQVINANN